MIYYLNFGFILEQALCDVVKTYLDRLQLDRVYQNFHISVTNQHPFAHMIIDQNARCSDSFPSVVISSSSDRKVPDLMNMPVQYTGIGLTSTDIDELINDMTREKKKVDRNGELVTIVKNGIIQKELIPGYVFVYDDETINKLKEIADSRTVGEEKGSVYGIKYITRRHDRISVEIWAENNQLKNEIYEHLRLLFTTSLEKVLKERYSMFDISLFDKDVSGERSNNYNMDFDALLCGSNLSFEMDYSICQIMIDTEIDDINYDLITEVINHVKV